MVDNASHIVNILRQRSELPLRKTWENLKLFTRALALTHVYASLCEKSQKPGRIYIYARVFHI